MYVNCLSNVADFAAAVLTNLRLGLTGLPTFPLYNCTLPPGVLESANEYVLVYFAKKIH